MRASAAEPATIALGPQASPTRNEEFAPSRAEASTPNIDPRGNTPENANAPRPNTGNPAMNGPDFHAIQQRLQTLGATYYKLEMTAKQQTFRFHCRVLPHDGSGLTRHFEAADPDPVTSMRKVLDQIEQYRAAH